MIWRPERHQPPDGLARGVGDVLVPVLVIAFVAAVLVVAVCAVLGVFTPDQSTACTWTHTESGVSVCERTGP